jgi:hypothetical protein
MENGAPVVGPDAPTANSELRGLRMQKKFAISLAAKNWAVHELRYKPAIAQHAIDALQCPLLCRYVSHNAAAANALASHFKLGLHENHPLGGILPQDPEFHNPQDKDYQGAERTLRPGWFLHKWVAGYRVGYYLLLRSLPV